MGLTNVVPACSCGAFAPQLRVSDRQQPRPWKPTLSRRRESACAHREPPDGCNAATQTTAGPAMHASCAGDMGGSIGAAEAAEAAEAAFASLAAVTEACLGCISRGSDTAYGRRLANSNAQY
jgi:hypothetical protein